MKQPSTTQAARSAAALRRRRALKSVSDAVLRGPYEPPVVTAQTVFVAYARQERALAHALVKDLAALGYQVTWDGDLMPGTPFRRHIQALLSAAGAILVIWSEAASRSDFVADEANVGAKRRCLIPTLAPGATEEQIPLGFRSSHCISVHDTDGIVRALAALKIWPIDRA